MKKLNFLAAALLSFSLISCSNDGSSSSVENYKIDYEGKKSEYSTGSIKSDYEYSRADGKIVLTPAAKADEDSFEYEFSGYFNEQIVASVKGTVIKLNGAYLESTDGTTVITVEKTSEIKSEEGTVNYVVSNGSEGAKSAAIQSEKKNVKIGGKGTLFVVGNVCHGIKADDVEFKGSGFYWIQGTENGSAVNCNTFTVDAERSFKAYIINSKNGIKADNTITCASGSFVIANNTVGLKTDTNEDDPLKPHGITLSGGTYIFVNNTERFVTEGEPVTTGAVIN